MGSSHVALGLGHLLSVVVAYQAVDVDRRGTGPRLRKLQPHHDHPRDPEEDDVEAGDQYVCSG